MSADQPPEAAQPPPTRRLRHLFDGDETNVYNSEFCNLCAGTPGPDLLRRCVDIFEEATAHRMAHERKDAFLFQYGATDGPWDFREELSRFLSKRYDDQVNEDDLVLTCGASHGLQLILNSFIEPDGVIFVEEVTYMIAIAVFREFSGMKIVSVPFSDTGVVASELERLAREEKAKRGDRSTGKPFWAVFYSIPVYHNPTGVCTSQEVGAEVVRVAQSLGFLVACDDVYNLLHYGAGAAPRRLHSLERSLAPPAGAAGPRRRHVVSNGSFSKILAPGVRVGWLEAPADLVQQLRTSGILRSGGGVNSYTAGVICSALQLGLLDKHLDHLVATFRGRMRALCDALEAALPAGCSLHPARPAGGYFVWLRLPPGLDAEAVQRHARDTRRVSAFPGALFSPASASSAHGPAAGSSHLRLAIAFHDEQRLAAAARDLCSAIAELIQQRGDVLV
ncbi:2-aminoadipate transaminase [Frankliniella occidentalis]|uniref:2-aminoadipate transaminase n=1 Tax=Frankliniella occidentalis TaxID=133901 RepID=A0A9C6X657_FRAOC|nr:2-aminoadipate transaminase [Frankliniella occidentalis]